VGLIGFVEALGWKQCLVDWRFGVTWVRRADWEFESLRKEEEGWEFESLERKRKVGVIRGLEIALGSWSLWWHWLCGSFGFAEALVGSSA